MKGIGSLWLYGVNVWLNLTTTLLKTFVPEKALYYVGPKNNFKKRALTNVDEVIKVLRQFHSSPMAGHSGVNCTLGKISQYHIWHRMKEDVTDYVGIYDTIISISCVLSIEIAFHYMISIT